MGIKVYSLSWVMQDFYHQSYQQYSTATERGQYPMITDLKSESQTTSKELTESQQMNRGSLQAVSYTLQYPTPKPPNPKPLNPEPDTLNPNH